MLSKTERVVWLKSVEVFANTPDDILCPLAAILEEIKVPVGEIIIREGEPGDCMYLVVDGELQAFALGKHVGSFISGEIVGEMAVLDSEPRSASVVAMTDALLFRLGQAPFDQAMAERPEIAKGIIRMLVHRLRVREARLQTELQQLRIEIDQMRKQRQVTEITETDFFTDLQTKAAEMRSRRQTIKRV